MEPSKYKFLVMLLPLYTKIAKSKVLDRFVRGEVYACILMNPGIHYNQIKRELGISNGNLAYHLSVLQREDYIWARNSSVYKCFYAKKTPKRKGHVHLTDIQRTIIKVIRDHPGLSQSAIGKHLGIRRDTVNYHVKRLRKVGMVKVVIEGKKSRCYYNRQKLKAKN